MTKSSIMLVMGFMYFIAWIVGFNTDQPQVFRAAALIIANVWWVGSILGNVNETHRRN